MSENKDRPSYGQEYGGGQDPRSSGAEYGGGQYGAGQYGNGQGGREYGGGSEYGQSPYSQSPAGQQPQQWGGASQQGAYPPPQGAQGGNGPTPQQWQGQPGQQWGGAPQGQPQQQWQGQPGQPWQGQPWGGPFQEPQRPKSITTAFWLIIAAAIVMVGSTLAGAFALTTPEGRAMVQDAARQQVEGSGLSGAEAQQMVDMTIGMMPGFMVALALVALALYLLVAFKIRSGSRAARVVGTVLAALSVLLLLVSVVSGALGLEIVWVLLGVAGIVMAYRPDATEYMRQKAWAKTMR